MFLPIHSQKPQMLIINVSSIWLAKADLTFWCPLRVTHLEIVTFPLRIERKILQSHCGWCLMIFTISTQTRTQHCSASSVLLGGCVRIIRLHKNFSYNVHQALTTEMLSLLLVSFFLLKVGSCHLWNTKIQEMPGFDRPALRSAVGYTVARAPDRCDVQNVGVLGFFSRMLEIGPGETLLKPWVTTFIHWAALSLWGGWTGWEILWLLMDRDVLLFHAWFKIQSSNWTLWSSIEHIINMAIKATGIGLSIWNVINSNSLRIYWAATLN